MDDFVSTWATKIAEEAAPDEVDLAPVMAQAYVSGGKARKELLRQSRSGMQGAFSPEIIVVLFPYILEAIRVVGPYLQDFLGSVSRFFTDTQPVIGGVSQLLGAVNALLTISHLRKREEKKESLSDESQQLATFREQYEDLKKVNALLREELQKQGLDENLADLTSYRVLRAMLEDPAGAFQFTREVSKPA